MPTPHSFHCHGRRPLAAGADGGGAGPRGSSLFRRSPPLIPHPCHHTRFSGGGESMEKPVMSSFRIGAHYDLTVFFLTGDLTEC